jgi:hypothetical protein
MSLKTSPSHHYHGSDGVYAEARGDAGLNLYWGESKIFKNATDAIRECLESLAPFLIQPDGADAAREQDILLVNEFANFTDQRLVNGLKRFLDRDDRSSLLTKHCGIALTGFDSTGYATPDGQSTADAILAAIRTELSNWIQSVERRIHEEKLTSFDVHFICIPMPSANDFRSYLQILGLKE